MSTTTITRLNGKSAYRNDGDGDFGLVRPGAAEFARAAGHYCAGIAEDQEFGDHARGHRFPIVPNYRCNIFRFSLDRDLAAARSASAAGLPDQKTARGKR